MKKHTLEYFKWNDLCEWFKLQCDKENFDEDDFWSMWVDVLGHSAKVHTNDILKVFKIDITNYSHMIRLNYTKEEVEKFIHIIETFLTINNIEDYFYLKYKF